jgi:hypothetical protein
MNWNFKGGVIIIGSLLWQDYLEKEGDDIRANWRNAHLDLANKIPVKVPIRYGRRSQSSIMTMVFSNRMATKTGFGYVVPFKRRINCKDELLCEAYALSAAEGMKGNFVRSWGVLAYLLNESRMDENQRKEIVAFFRRQRRNAQFDIKDYKVGKERSCISKSLKLDINWVAPVSGNDQHKIDEFHFLLATATKPDNKLPTYQEVAQTIKDDKQRRYFINNLINGIITHDDFEIAKLL